MFIKPCTGGLHTSYHREKLSLVFNSGLVPNITSHSKNHTQRKTAGTTDMPAVIILADWLLFRYQNWCNNVDVGC